MLASTSWWAELKIRSQMFEILQPTFNLWEYKNLSVSCIIAERRLICMALQHWHYLNAFMTASKVTHHLFFMLPVTSQNRAGFSCDFEALLWPLLDMGSMDRHKASLLCVPSHVFGSHSCDRSSWSNGDRWSGTASPPEGERKIQLSDHYFSLMYKWNKICK